jgi:hypothetical protein
MGYTMALLECEFAVTYGRPRLQVQALVVPLVYH